MDDYKSKIDRFLESAQNQFLKNSYGSDLSELSRKLTDYKNFVVYLEDFKVETDEKPEVVKAYFYEKLDEIHNEFFG
ncbi:hypothetical protein [Epilithonimonas caeni]|uniref:hypothetical protein n=1 Tax=Epilithonimonas caeni TaxID=365343 RepID=UPI0003F6A8B0|nr:hypothetical protein [Epilithonimonas caeni]